MLILYLYNKKPIFPYSLCLGFLFSVHLSFFSVCLFASVFVSTVVPSFNKSPLSLFFSLSLCLFCIRANLCVKECVCLPRNHLIWV